MLSTYFAATLAAALFLAGAAGAPAQENLKPDLQRPNLKLFTVRRDGDHKGYSLHVRYPQFRGQPAPLVRTLNRRIKLLINRNICTDPHARGGRNYYSCDYKSMFLTPELMSIDFEFQGVPGTRRGRYYHVPYNCRLYPTFKELKLRDVLGRRLTTAQLSDLCIPKLKQTFKDDLSLPSNTDLGREAFTSFTFDKAAITFTFPEGYVAAAALTCPEVKIPYHEMLKYFSPRSPVYKYVLLSRNRSVKPHAKQPQAK